MELTLGLTPKGLENELEFNLASKGEGWLLSATDENGKFFEYDLDLDDGLLIFSKKEIFSKIQTA